MTTETDSQVVLSVAWEGRALTPTSELKEYTQNEVGGRETG